MRQTALTLPYLLAAFLGFGCKNSDQKADPQDTQWRAPSAQQDKATSQTRQPVDAIAEYTFTQKKEFIAAMRKELDDTQAELTRLSARVEKAEATVKTDATIRLDAARGKWMRAMDELKRADDATPTTWDQIKGAFKSAYGEMHDQVSQTRKWLSDRMAP